MVTTRSRNIEASSRSGSPLTRRRRAAEPDAPIPKRRRASRAHSPASHGDQNQVEDAFAPDTPPPSLSSASPSTSRPASPCKLTPVETLSLAYEPQSPTDVRGEEAGQLASLLRNPGPCSVYISGMPGAGKSLTVARVLRELVEVGELASAFHLNCTSLKSPKIFYNSVANLLGLAGGLSSVEAFAKSGASGPSSRTVLVLDEVDALKTCSLYRMFELPYVPQSRIAVVGISNALDFSVKSMPLLRASNRLPKAISFKPYTSAELAAIVETRLNEAVREEEPALPAIAISLVSKKVAALSGDARVALDICRSAAMSHAANPAKSTVALVASDLAQRGRSTAAVDAIELLPTQHQMVLVAVAKRLGSPGKKISFGAMYDFYKQLCSKAKVVVASFSEVVEIFDCLVASGLALTAGRKDPRSKSLQLAPATELQDIRDAVSDKPLLVLMLS